VIGNKVLEEFFRQLLAAPAGATMPLAERPAATWRACIRKMLNIEMQIPYATSTPDANDANTAEINTIEFTATPLMSGPAPENAPGPGSTLTLLPYIGL